MCTCICICIYIYTTEDNGRTDWRKRPRDQVTAALNVHSSESCKLVCARKNKYGHDASKDSRTTSVMYHGWALVLEIQQCLFDCQPCKTVYAVEWFGNESNLIEHTATLTSLTSI